MAEPRQAAPFARLFSPFTLRGVTMRNRLMQTAHARGFGREGIESERDIAYFVERARGGIGMISVGSTTVHPTGSIGLAGLSNSFMPGYVESLRALTAAVHAEGAAIFSQLNHCGPSAMTSVTDHYAVLWGPSEMHWGPSGEQAKAMELEDIREIVEAFAEAAVLGQEAGVDGVEIVIAHDYLLGSFLSPIANRRTDEYGGSLENRLRFGREVVEATRRRVGPDFVLGVRLSLAEELPGGFTLDDTCAWAQMLIADGHVDFFTLTTGGGAGQWKSLQTGYFPQGFLIDQTATFKRAVGDVAVFAVGGIDDPEMAESVLENGYADMVAITRGHIADPAFANKAKEGRSDEIYHCIRGNQGCSGRLAAGKPISCTVNPAAGRELHFGAGTQTPAEKPGRWLVVGGGAAGLKAAEGLAQRGHQVALVEKEAELGGQVNVMMKMPGRGSWHWIKTDLERSLQRLGVTILPGQPATPEFVFGFEADGVILATGSRQDETGWSVVGPPPPGLSSARVLTLRDAILNPADAGKRVVLLDDEGQQRIAAAAELLMDQGSEVILVTRHASLFPHLASTWELPPVYERLLPRGLSYQTGSWASRVDGRTVQIVNLFSRQERTITDVDAIVLGTVRRPDQTLYDALKGRVANLHRIGDCLAARTMDHAIYEGFLAGRELFSWSERPFFDREGAGGGRPLTSIQISRGA